MLPVDLRVKQLKLNQIHNIVRGKAPTYLTSSFSPNTSRHNTRSGPLSQIIPSVKSLGLSTFNYTGAVACNNLPDDIDPIRTKPNFKYKVKVFYLTNVLNKKKPFYCTIRFLYIDFFNPNFLRLFVSYMHYYCLIYVLLLFLHTVNLFCLSLFYWTTMEISVFTFYCASRVF